MTTSHIRELEDELEVAHGLLRLVGLRYDGENISFGALDAAVAAEREACAKLVEEAFGILPGCRMQIAANIRARGKPCPSS